MVKYNVVCLYNRELISSKNKWAVEAFIEKILCKCLWKQPTLPPQLRSSARHPDTRGPPCRRCRCCLSCCSTAHPICTHLGHCAWNRLWWAFVFSSLWPTRLWAPWSQRSWNPRCATSHGTQYTDSVSICRRMEGCHVYPFSFHSFPSPSKKSQQLWWWGGQMRCIERTSSLVKNWVYICHQTGNYWRKLFCPSKPISPDIQLKDISFSKVQRNRKQE